jgi:aryl-alcohol dehydrogenase-like predicted oxidoreductase
VQQAERQNQFGLGCVNLGGKGQAGVSLVHEALDLGVSFFDTADAYGSGQSERVLGRALRRRRDQAFVATKGGYLFHERSLLVSATRGVASRCVQLTDRWRASMHAISTRAGTAYNAQDFSPSHLRDALEGSLRRLRTDFVDLYQLHGPRGIHDDVIALMLQLRSEGKIRAFGVGLEVLGDTERWLTTRGLSSIQLPFGILDPDAGVDFIPRASDLGINVVVRGVFAGGFVARTAGSDMTLLRLGQPERLRALEKLASAHGVDAMQLAAWFVTTRPGVSTVLVGTTSRRHLNDSVRYVRTPAPEAILQDMDELVAQTVVAPVPSE